MVVGGGLAFCSDVVAQQVNHKFLRFELKKLNFQGVEKTKLAEHDWIRSVRMGSLASFLFIPIDFKWFQLADKWFPGKALRKVFKN